MKLETFEVEKWMDEHENNNCTHNLAETCCASISLTDLLALSNTPALDLPSLIQPDTKQTYGEIRGNSTLRSNLAALYSAKSPTPLKPDNVLITPGAIAANFLAFYALLKPGDGVVCMYPTYQQLYSVPRSLGCDVKLWKARLVDRGSAWKWDVDELKRLIERMEKDGKGVRMVVLNNPNNPTGAILSKSTLQSVIDLCKSKDILILSDEVYRPIFHGIGPMDDNFPGSALSSFYDRVIVTGSLSKAYSLAGLRVGWLASWNRELVDEIAAARHYTTISVSQIDQQIAALATSQLCLHALLGKNIKLARENVKLVQGFVDEHYRSVEWVKPVAGTTCFIRFARGGQPVDDVAFCETLQRETGVMLLPGSRGFGDEEGSAFRGYVRVGFCNETSIVKEGLEKLKGFMKKGFKQVPLLEEEEEDDDEVKEEGENGTTTKEDKSDEGAGPGVVHLPPAVRPPYAA